MTDLQPADWEANVVDEVEQAAIDQLHQEINAPGHRDALNVRITALEAEIEKAKEELTKIPVVGEAAAEVVDTVETKVKEEIPVVEERVKEEAPKLEETVVEKVVEEVKDLAHEVVDKIEGKK